MALDRKSQNFTRGGQIFWQNIGMSMQVFGSIFYWSFIAAVLALVAVLALRLFLLEEGTFLLSNWFFAKCDLWIDQTSSAIASSIANRKIDDNVMYHLMYKGKEYVIPLKDFLSSPKMLKFQSYMISSLCWGIAISILVGGSVAFAMYRYFSAYGTKLSKDNTLRGKSIIPGIRFVNFLPKKERSHFKVAFATPLLIKKGYPKAQEKSFHMPINFEVRHTLAHGTNGSGKSQLMNQFLDQAIEVKGKKIIFDRNGHAAEIFFNKTRGDKILNPFDKRTERWSLFNEFRSYEDFKILASFLIPEGLSQSDKYWVNSPRKVIVDSLMSMGDNKSYAKFLHMLTFMSTKELHQELLETSSRRIISVENNKMSNSIQAIISTYADAFETLAWLEKESHKPLFSIRDWLMDESKEGCLFVTYPNEQAEALRPLLTIFFSLVIHWSLSMSSDPKRRIFLFCDELAAFNRLDKLHAALAEGRKYGLSLFLATQNYFDIIKVYGQNEAISILDQINSKFFLRSKESKTCEFVSTSLGEQEVETVMQNRAYSMNEYRDGVTAYTHKEIRKLVLASEISDMKDLECYMDTIACPLVHFNLYYREWNKQVAALESIDSGENYRILKQFMAEQDAYAVHKENIEKNKDIKLSEKIKEKESDLPQEFTL